MVERCKTFGAISLGKTNVSKFGYSATGENPLFPTTLNQWNLDLTPGDRRPGPWWWWWWWDRAVRAGERW